MNKSLPNPMMPDVGMYSMGIVFGKGRPSSPAPVQTPVYTPPAAAPAPAPATAPTPATIVASGGTGATAAGAIDDDGVTEQSEEARKKRAMKVGAKSLQIPTSGGAGSTSTVGTGSSSGSSGTGR